MATKPQRKPEWAVQGAAPKIEPNQAHRDMGWGFGEKPPHEWFNWWMNNVYQWSQYLDELNAGQVPATWQGQPSTVQAALNQIPGAINAAQINAQNNPILQANSVTLRELQDPGENNTTPDLWSGASGALVYDGVCWPDNGVTSLSWGAGTSQNPSVIVANNGLGLGAGVVCRDLTITAPTSVYNRGPQPFVVRVHGNLNLNARLTFHADQWAPAAHTAAASAQSLTAGNGAGGCGIIGAGGMGGDGVAGFNFTMSSVAPHKTLNDLRSWLRTTVALGDIGAALPWFASGGTVGGTGTTTAGWGSFPKGGGVAVLLVSGDIVVGGSSSNPAYIACNGQDGDAVLPAGHTYIKGAGGGGGGALMVVCGGRIRQAQGSSQGMMGLFQACGGSGSYGSSSGGGGGGGGLAWVVARNLHPVHVYASYGAGRGGGIDGGTGAATVLKAVPRLMA